MQIKEVPESKKWAENLTDDQFEVEWQRRFPLADVMPKREEWMYKPEPSKNRCPRLPSADDYEIEPIWKEEKPVPAQKIEHPEPKLKPHEIVTKCICGKECKGQFGLQAHQKRCKTFLNTRG